MAKRALFIASVTSVPVADAVTLKQGTAATATANPVRKVVNLLQKMQRKVAEEREKADDLYEKFMCYCRSSGGDLQKSIDAAEDKIPELESSIKASTGKLAQLKDDLKSDQEDNRAAKKTMEEATALREKEKAAYDKAYDENKANLGAASKAVVAVSEGMGDSFLQTTAAGALRAFLSRAQASEGDSSDRQQLSAFLAGEYAPASGQIVGILKTMVDEMTADQEEMVAAEKKAVEEYTSLMKSKKKEVSALQKAIENGMERISETSVAIAEMKNDLEDTAEGLEQDKKFAADLKKDCATKGEMHEKDQKLRGQELAALADTIKILNDDDALDLFKKTLPSASASLLQVQESMSTVRSRAFKALSSASKHHRLDFVLLALRGKKVGFDKIINMIDELVASLEKEAADDADKKEYCEEQFDLLDDEKKSHERTIKDTKTVIEEAKEGISTLTEELKALEEGIVALDKALTEATNQRKAETKEYKELMASDSAAKELILFAKNRLNKFYNPKLYKAPAKKELSKMDRISENMGSSFVQVSAKRDAPPPPPETAAAYSKKSEESGGVLAMMDLLVADLDKEMTEAKTEEDNAQEEYEQLVKDSAEKRTKDSKSMGDKEAAKADLQSSLEESLAKEKSATKELSSTVKAIADLHAECDWLLKYFDVRSAARNDEVEALKNAKAVLNGADFSF